MEAKPSLKKNSLASLLSGNFIPVGIIGRPHGVKGAVRVKVLAETAGVLTEYGPLSDRLGKKRLLTESGVGLFRVADMIKAADGTESAGQILSREEAAALTGTTLYLDRTLLPPLGAEEFYFSDLQGLDVFSPEGKLLGKIKAVHDYGGGVSLEITFAADFQGKSSGLVPFTKQFVPEVAVKAGRITVVLPVETSDESGPA